jgi:histidyl-tRNA synthetase
MSFASDTKSHFSIVIGATEVAAGEVVLKNMQTGEQSPVAYTADASAILAAIAGDT